MDSSFLLIQQNSATSAMTSIILTTRVASHPGDEGGLAWNDPEIGIEWPELTGTYNGSASGEGYALSDGTKLNLSDKDQLWDTLENTFKFD